MTHFHLTMRIDNDCPIPEWYQPVLTTNGERGLTYSEVPTEVLVEFWVVDLDGTLVVADMWHDIGAPQDLIEQAARARASMSILPVGLTRSAAARTEPDAGTIAFEG